MNEAIVFYEDVNGATGIRIHTEGETVLEVLRERFQGNYKRIVEWINDGILGGGYMTPEDYATVQILGETVSETHMALNSVDIALSEVPYLYRVNKNGTITRVEALLHVEFAKL